jgi:hypothetical protein
VIKSKSIRLAGYVAYMGDIKCLYRILFFEPGVKSWLGKPRQTWKDNIKMDLKK